MAAKATRTGALNVINARFDAKTFPVAAASYLEKQPAKLIFTRDDWSGYLIYRLYPHDRLFFDDRHDFYGEARIRDYVKMIDVGLGWQQVLQRWGVNWVLMNPESPLTNALKISPDWTVIHDDGVAVLFARRKPLRAF